MVCANREYPLFSLMRDLIATTYGHVPSLRETLVPIDEVEQALTYGSRAARRLDEPWEFPRDIDVLVAGTASRKSLAEAASSASARIGADVSISRVSRTEWEASEPSQFVLTVKSRPTVDLLTRNSG